MRLRQDLHMQRRGGARLEGNICTANVDLLYAEAGRWRDLVRCKNLGDPAPVEKTSLKQCYCVHDVDVVLMNTTTTIVGSALAVRLAVPQGNPPSAWYNATS